MKRQARLTFSCTISPNPELLPAGEQSRERMARRIFGMMIDAMSAGQIACPTKMISKVRRILDEHSNARKAKRSVELGRRRNRASTIVLTRESRYEPLPGTPSFAQVPRGVWPFEV